MKHLRLLLFILLSTTLSFGQSSKISPDLQSQLRNSGSVNVIVQYNPNSSSSSGSGGGLLGGVLGLVGGILGGLLGLITDLGGIVTQQYSSIPALAATMPASKIMTLANNSSVAYVSADRALQSLSESSPVDINTASADADLAYESGYTGAGVGIAIVDSGIYPHPDLAGRIVYSQSWQTKVNPDDYGHGTHVAGIAAGSGASSTGPQFTQSFRGVAPKASLIDLRVLDANGMSSDSLVIAAIDRAVQLKSKYNIRVMNLSIGRPIFESSSLDPLCVAVAEAWKSGIVVVVAAGNLGRNGYSTVISPGNSPYAITVGAMKSEGTPQRSDDLIASYSSRGPTWIDFTAKPDIVAPGNLVGSLLAPGSTLSKQYPANVIAPSAYMLPGYTAPPTYFTLSGTSMATPVVSGAAAILIQREPSLTPDTIKARLMKTASKSFPLSSVAVDPTTGVSYVDFYDIFTIGAGYVDVYAALNNSDTSEGYAYSPAVVWNPRESTALLVNPSSSVWNSSTWNITNVWGTQVFLGGTSAAWGDSGIWGSSAAWGDSGIWGTSAAWGDSGGWSTSAAWGDSVGGIGEH